MRLRPRNSLIYLCQLGIATIAILTGNQAKAVNHIHASHRVPVTRSSVSYTIKKAVHVLPKATLLTKAKHIDINKVGPVSLQQTLNVWVSRPELIHSLVGISIIDLSSGREIAAINSHKRFNPASTAKIFVTACVFEKLGANYRFSTKLATDIAQSGPHLDGDLILETSQDPSLTLDDVKTLFADLKHLGIKDINGRLVLLEPQGGGERFFPGWLLEDWGQAWMPVCSSLVIDHNLAAANTLAHMDLSYVSNQNSKYSLLNNAWSKALLDSDKDSSWLTFDQEKKKVIVYSAKENDTSSALKPLSNPDTYNLAMCEEIAQGNAIHIRGHNLPVSNDKQPLITLSEHLSPPLSQLIKITLHESDNLYAQQLLRRLGIDSPDIRLSLEEKGLNREEQWVKLLNIPEEEFVLVDGCGLSRKNYLSPFALSSVLEHIFTTPAIKSYLSLLNTAQIKPGGNFLFKTGAMDSVRGVTGILYNCQEHPLAVTILVNGHAPSVKDLRTSINILVSQLASIKLTPTDIPKDSPENVSGNTIETIH